MQVRVWEDLSVKDPEAFQKEFSKLGLSVQIEATTYGSVREMIISNGKNEIRFSSAPTVSRKKPPTIKKYEVTGRLHGIAVKEVFDTEELADDRKSKLNEVSATGKCFSVSAIDFELPTIN